MIGIVKRDTIFLLTQFCVDSAFQLVRELIFKLSCFGRLINQVSKVFDGGIFRSPNFVYLFFRP